MSFFRRPGADERAVEAAMRGDYLHAMRLPEKCQDAPATLCGLLADQIPGRYVMAFSDTWAAGLGLPYRGWPECPRCRAIYDKQIRGKYKVPLK